MARLYFVHRPFPLAGDIENFAQVDMRPDFGPFGFQIALPNLTKLVGGRLVIVLQKISFGDPIMRQSMNCSPRRMATGARTCGL
jgi:hypothetical protein